jgi:hypothetical protein
MWAHVCIQPYSDASGDVPNIVACSHASGENTYVCSYFVCDQYTNPVDCTSNLLPFEECMCAYYDVSYCDDYGGGNVDGELSNLIDPCGVANDLKKDTIKNKQDIKNMRDSAKNGKTETANYYKRNTTGNYNSSGNASGNYDSLGINGTSPTTPFDGFWHNHFNKTGVINMFSSGDIVTLVAFNNGNLINNRSTFVFGLTNHLDNSYMLSITDSTKFSTYASSFDLSSTTGSDAALHAISLAMEVVYRIVDGASQTENEKRMAQFLLHQNTGLQLIKVDINNNNYTKINYNPETANATYSPCN